MWFIFLIEFISLYLKLGVNIINNYISIYKICLVYNISIILLLTLSKCHCYYYLWKKNLTMVFIIPNILNEIQNKK
jgi:hypothetical protein